MEKIIAATMDKEKENLKKLTSLFPTIWTEVIRYEKDGKEYENPIEGGNPITKKVIDPKKLRKLVGDTAGETEEIFQFTWAGKRDAEKSATSPTSLTLRPCVEDSVGKDGTIGGFDSRNLYIEGENLDVLKLLEQAYTGQVKLIYIDPPYNTGGCFIYNDKFKASKQKWKEESNEFDDEGNRLFNKNTGGDGRYHTNWLNMMYPRLIVAQKLLTEDGVIFISIDDREQANLKKICDEIFGEENFVNNISVKMSELSGVKMKGLKKYPKIKETLLIYAKDIFKFKIIIEKKIKDEKTLNNYLGYYSNIILNPKEPTERWQISSLNNYFKKNNINFKNDEELKKWKIDNAERLVYRTNSRTVDKFIEKNPNAAKICLFYNADGNAVYKWDKKEMLFLCDYINDYLGDIWLDISTINLNKENMEIPFFENGQKPLALIKRILQSVDTKDQIILDFFSGSATTAHAVILANAETNKNRRFIMVQIPDDLDETLPKVNGDTKKILIETIAFLDKIGKKHLLTEIGKERLRRAGTKAGKGDIGFRVLKLDKGSLRDVHKRPDEYTMESLLDSIDKIDYKRSGLDLLFTTMIYSKISLDSAIEEKMLEGKKVYIIRNAGLPGQICLACCFDNEITEGVVKQMAMLKPGTAVFNDKSFKSDDVKISMQQIIKTYSPSTKTAVLESM